MISRFSLHVTLRINFRATHMIEYIHAVDKITIDLSILSFTEF